MKVHLWNKMHEPGVFLASCGALVPFGQGTVTGSTYEPEGLSEVTCRRCLRSERDYKLRTVARDAVMAQALTERLDKLDRKARRRKAASPPSAGEGDA